MIHKDIKCIILPAQMSVADHKIRHTHKLRIGRKMIKAGCTVRRNNRDVCASKIEPRERGKFFSLLLKGLVLLIALLMITAAPASGQQTNPATADCGLPPEGTIWQSAIYTLTADCTQTGELDLRGASVVTILGNEKTIDASALTKKASFIDGAGKELTMRDVTLVGGGISSNRGIRGSLHLNKPATLTNVTIRDTFRSAIWAGGDNTFTLTNILIENAEGQYNSYERAPAAVDVLNGAQVNISNIALRNIFGGSAAIGIGDKGKGVTISGCLSAERVMPQVFFDPDAYGDISDKTSGACSGAIGNGGSAAKQVAEPKRARCGLPSEGHLERSADYTLTSDCQQSGPLFIPKGVTVTIDGYGHTINAVPGFLPILSAGDLTLRNLAISGSSNGPLSTRLTSKLIIENVIFFGNGGPVEIVDNVATLDQVIFESNSNSRTRNFDSSALRVLLSADVTIRDSIFRNNSGGQGALFAGAAHFIACADNNNELCPGSSTTLEGCITWAVNSPADVAPASTSRLTDNSSGACHFDKLVFPALAVADDSQSNGAGMLVPPDICARPKGIDAIPMGAIACIFRWNGDMDGVLQVWEIDPQTSEGFYQLTVTQPEVEAVRGREAVVAVSLDGRALVVVWADGNVTVKVGPDLQGKIVHVTLKDGVGGEVINLTSTYGPAPGLPYIGNGK